MGNENTRNNLKRRFNKEFLFLIGAVLTMGVAIVFNSLFIGGFKSGKEFWQTFLTDSLINTAISIFGVIAGIPYGIVLTKEKRTADGGNGRYIQEYTEYAKTRKLVDDKRKHFSQWHNQQHLYELRQKKINYLLDNGITQAELILELNLTEALTLLDTPQVFTVNDEKIFFKSLTLDQIEKVKIVFSGKIKVAKLSDQYFLYPEGKGRKSFYEQADKETATETKSIVSKTIYKVLLGTIITIIFTATTMDLIDMNSKTEMIRAFTKMFIRIFNGASSIFWGILIGQEHTYMILYYLAGRTDFLKLFNSDTSFKYKEDEEIAKEEFAKRILGEGLLLTTNNNNENIKETKELKE